MGGQLWGALLIFLVPSVLSRNKTGRKLGSLFCQIKSQGRRFVITNKILLATDLTPASRAAEQSAFDLARQLNVKLAILHVIPERSSFGMSTIPPEFADRDELNHRLQMLGKDEAPNAACVLVDGAPGRRIPEVAQSEDADLIVKGTRGRTGVSRAVLGSIAEVVVRDSHCPVLLVKPAAEDGGES